MSGLSVVIATRNRARVLSRALDSLATQRDAPEFEVIVVDNGSTDGTPAMLSARADGPAAPRYVHVAEPNRGLARNAGVAIARGDLIVFVDDDVWLPPQFLAAHAAAHREPEARVVSGPILNVPSYERRPKPSPFNYSNAFLCTCNVSLPRASLLAVDGFDTRFNLYGWEDTELGLRLRRSGVRRAFAWDAFLYHVKPPGIESLDTLAQKARERAQMAARLLDKDDGLRTRLATGAYAPNLWRAALFAPERLAGSYRRAADDPKVPGALRAIARGQYLDAVYTGALRRALEERRH